MDVKRYRTHRGEFFAYFILYRIWRSVFILFFCASPVDGVLPFLCFKVHIRWRDAVLQVGKMGVLRRVVLLLHIAEHHRVRWLRARQRDPGPGQQHRFQLQPAGERRAELHPVRHVPDARYGPDRHVFQSDAAGRGDEDQDVHGHTAEDHPVQKLTRPSPDRTRPSCRTHMAVRRSNASYRSTIAAFR